MSVSLNSSYHTARTCPEERAYLTLRPNSSIVNSSCLHNKKTSPYRRCIIPVRLPHCSRTAEELLLESESDRKDVDAFAELFHIYIITVYPADHMDRAVGRFYFNPFFQTQFRNDLRRRTGTHFSSVTMPRSRRKRESRVIHKPQQSSVTNYFRQVHSGRLFFFHLPSPMVGSEYQKYYVHVRASRNRKRPP